jgi:hypothetical protein
LQRQAQALDHFEGLGLPHGAHWRDVPHASLFQELVQLYKAEPAVFCFDNLAEGLEHFVKTTGAKAENLPTPEETKQIKKEQESLPPIGWLTNYDDSAHIGLHFADALIMRDSLWKPALGSQGILEGGFEFPSSPAKKTGRRVPNDLMICRSPNGRSLCNSDFKISHRQMPVCGFRIQMFS